MNNIKMLYHVRIDVSERIDINKTGASKECLSLHVCNYWYLLSKGFKFQPCVCNKCHDLLMSINLSDIAILDIKGATKL